MKTFIPAEPIPPGEYLQDEIDARGWTQDDLSEVTGLSRRQLINIIQGKSGVTKESAQKIAAAFNQDPITWMNLQVAYELANDAKDQREVQQKAKLFDKVPVREIHRRGWISEIKDTQKLESEVCRLLNVGHIDDLPKLSLAARKSQQADAGYEFTNPAQLAWYSRVRQLGHLAPVACDYKQSNWEGGVEELLKLSTEASNVRLVPRVLSDMGIRLVLVEHIKKTKIDGVALWLNPESPIIGLSVRYDRIDNFWFSLIHELIHVKHKHACPVDTDLGKDAEELPEMEKVANREAGELLVPSENLQSFILRCGPTYYKERVVQFSRSLGVHPGIVVGQLQHRKEITYAKFPKLREKIRSHILGQAPTDGWGNTISVE